MEAQMLDLSYLLDSLAEGAMAVPDFQREFVWSDAQVRSLLGTALNGWPAGSLLLMRADHQIFQLRPLEAAPPISKVRYIVLDGQQRLTALYHALRNTGPSVYALDLSEIDISYFDQASLEDRIISFKRDDWDRTYSSLARQRARQLLPVYALRSAASFFEWRDDVTSQSGETDEDYRQTLTVLYRDYLSAVHRYNLPAVVLESRLEVAAIARIFEKVNRTGTLLNAFDLMVARVYEPGWNLRDQWEAARLADPLLDFILGTDGMPVLQSIALRERRDVRQSAVLDLPPHIIHRDWTSAIDGTSEAVRLCFERFGVRSADWLPYGVMLVALAALLGNGYSTEQNWDLIESWFWSRGFSQAFDAAANTRIVSDHDRLIRRSRSGLFSVSYSSPVDAHVLLGATRRGQRAIWAMFMCALASHGALDPLTMLPAAEESLLDTSSAQSKRAVDRMIVSTFARDYTDSESLHLRVLGLIQVGRRSASVVRSRGLSGLLRSAIEEHGAVAVNQALATQFMPSAEGILSGEISGYRLLDARLDRLTAFLAGYGVAVEDQSRSL
jgi:hypothetical protein